MKPAALFQKYVRRCRALAKSARTPEDRELWKGLAERWERRAARGTPTYSESAVRAPVRQRLVPWLLPINGTRLRGKGRRSDWQPYS